MTLLIAAIIRVCNLSIRNTIRSWSVMETIVGIIGLIGVLILDLFV